jgi:hypothetical protein
MLLLLLLLLFLLLLLLLLPICTAASSAPCSVSCTHASQHHNVRSMQPEGQHIHPLRGCRCRKVWLTRIDHYYYYYYTPSPAVLFDIHSYITNRAYLLCYAGLCDLRNHRLLPSAHAFATNQLLVCFGYAIGNW